MPVSIYDQEDICPCEKNLVTERERTEIMEHAGEDPVALASLTKTHPSCKKEKRSKGEAPPT